MSFNEIPTGTPASQEGQGNEEEISEEQLRNVKYEVFFKTPPNVKSIEEIRGRVREEAKKQGLPVDKLEEELALDIFSSMANSVD